MFAPDEARHVPRILAECGVRLVLVERLPQAKIDGACCWLIDSPVIGMSLRRDRIDNFWFVLRHEIEHVLQGDGQTDAIIDADLEGIKAGIGDDLPPEERAANMAASNYCVPTDKLLSFMKRKHPFYYEKDVIAFAQTVMRHPGLVIGQMQFRLNDDKYLGKKLALYKIRNHVLPGAIADGWGQVIRVNH